ncbi:hypothetical protein F5B22DRAFT_573910 [Xylaria bambusicola]|uniref:uncharacterized protein n=1 Tax=Xylaria bambusicola TaxID=326684 RepID=UPI0020086B16|nr:uncharacterized protein F5B22DRAFT_573910 [Xylaria bambusicola]KAI0503085.1 hypothetical protein F5B22DRAFT_573910 [Xylaria bambusicola]
MGMIDINEADDGESPISDASVDLVFVHGLHEPGKNAWIDQVSGILWMRDLFPYARYGARLLLYEYDVDRLMAPGGPNISSIFDEAVSLVNHLIASRELHQAEQRPIIFICHEFGGLLVKRALAYSHSRKGSRVEHIRSIYRSTVAIMFMATPHEGFKKEALIYTNRSRHPEPNNFMLSLLEGSEALQEITDHFAPIMKQFYIYNFWEQLRTAVGRHKIYIVDRTSASPSWNEVDQCGINTTHAGIVKFTSSASPGYRLVLAALDKYIKLSATGVARRWEQDLELIRKERQHEVENLLPGALLNHAIGAESIAHELITLRGAPSISTLTSPENSSKSLVYLSDSSEEVRTPCVNLHYLVNRRSEYYVGRQKQTEHLQQKFRTPKRKGQKPKVFVVYGLPGSGKTQFCLRYCEDNRHRYWGVFWIDCSTEPNAEDGFRSLGVLAGKGSQPGAGQAWLSHLPHSWLLILDNANDPEMDLSMFIPVSGDGHVLITTRNPGAQLYNTVGAFQFRGMDPEEAITLLLRLAYPEKEPDQITSVYRQDAGVIASELGYLALALKQAAHTIRTQFLPLGRYLQSLLGCRQALLSRPLVKSAADANIYATWELPFTDILNGTTQEHRDAVELVHIFAFMHFVSIPSNVFTLCSDALKSCKDIAIRPSVIVNSSSMQMVGDRVMTAARVLYDHSIISISELDHQSEIMTGKLLPKHYFTLHPAIHQWARERLQKDDRAKWLACTAAILEHSISTNMETSGRALRRLLLPHIEACLSVLQKTYWNFPENLEQASHLDRFALVYAEAGLWKKARSLQLKVVKLRSARLGAAHPLTIHSKRSLANSLWNLFDLKGCLEVQRQILMTQLWSRPSISDWLVWPPWKPVHVQYCTTLSDLAQSLWLAGLQDLSKRAGERAVTGLIQKYGSDDPLTLNAMFNLGRTYLHLEETEKSEAIFRHVLARREHFFGRDHPDTLMVRNELGMNLISQKGGLHEAESLVYDVLQVRQKILGEEHAYTLWSVNDLSKVYMESGRNSEAAAILEEIIPVVKRTLGDDHVGMFMTKGNLSRAYIRSDQWEQAGDLIKWLRKMVPPDHPDWVYAEWGYAYYVLHYEDDASTAEKCCKTIMSKVFETELLSASNARVIATVEILLRIYEEQGRNSEIKELKEKFPNIGSNTNVVESASSLPLPRWRLNKPS